MTNPWEGPSGNPPPFDPNQPPYPAPYPPPPPGYYPPPPGYPAPAYAQPPAHPQATTAIVLGILGLVLCGVAAPFALWLGRKSMTEIDASGGRLSGRGQAQAGFIMGIIGTVFLAIGLILVFTGVIGGIMSSPKGL
ncbi:MAG: DUF4190 domain-containing protein [Mycobacterium sp.]